MTSTKQRIMVLQRQWPLYANVNGEPNYHKLYIYYLKIPPIHLMQTEIQYINGNIFNSELFKWIDDIVENCTKVKLRPRPVTISTMCATLYDSISMRAMI